MNVRAVWDDTQTAYAVALQAVGLGGVVVVPAALFLGRIERVVQGCFGSHAISLRHAVRRVRIQVELLGSVSHGARSRGGPAQLAEQ